MAGEQIITISDFSPGLLTQADARAAPGGGAQVCRDVVTDRGDLRVRPGRVAFGTAAEGTSQGFRALCEFFVAGHDPEWRLVGICGERIYWCGADGAFSEIDAAVTVHATNPARMAQFGDRLYIVDGYHEVRELDADGRFTALEEFPAPTEAPALDTTTVDLPIDPADQTVCKSGDGQWQRYGGGAWFTPAPNKNQWYIITYPDWPTNAEVSGLYARAVTENAWPGKTASLALYITEGTGPGATMDCGDVWVCRKHENPPDNSLPAHWDLQEATAIRFSVRTTTGATTTFPAAMELLLGEDDDPLSWQSVMVTEDEDGTLLSAMTNDTWYNFVVDISGLTAAQRDAVRYIGFRFPDLLLSANDDDAAIIHFSPITANISSASFTPDTYEFTYTLFSSATEEESGEYIDAGDLANPYPSLSINAAIPQAITATCTRDVGHAATTAYLYARGGVSKVWRRIGEAAFAGDSTEARTVDIAWTGEYADAALLPEYVGKPPAGATMLCSWRNRMVYVGQLPMGKWKAATAYPAGEIIKPATRNGYEYACTAAGTSGTAEPSWPTTPGGTVTDGAVTWRCQEVGARDVLYFSNFGDPAHVPIAPTALQQVPATYGGWADLERWGHDVTGLAAYGSALAAFKRQGIWICQGDPGDVNFRIDELDRREGCLSHESIAQAEGKLIWQARDKILALGGMEIADISAPIAPTVHGYTAVQQGAAFAVYDPRTRRYQLTYPSGSYGAGPNSEALVLQLKTGGWTQFTAQPGGCGLYAQHAATPGVYLADPYGASGRGKVFRASADAATDAISYGEAAAIDWQWVSGEIVPCAGRYARVAALRGSLITAGTSGAYTLAAALWLNNSDDRTASRNLTVTRKTTLGSATQANGVVDWTLAPQGEVESFAVKLARHDSNLIAVRDISLVARAAAPARGRTVARA
jgi:hypothetical protein